MTWRCEANDTNQYLLAIFLLFAAGCGSSSSPPQCDFSCELGSLVLHQNRPEEWLVEREFLFTNNESQSISLKVKGSTCGCMVASLDPDELQPGKTAKIRIKATLPFVRQRRADMVFVETNSALTPRLCFSVLSDVFPAMTSRPNSRVVSLPFDSAGAESVSFELIGYRRLSDPPFETIRYESSLPTLEVSIDGLTRDIVGDFERFTASVGIEADESTFRSGEENIECKVRFLAWASEYECKIHYWRRSPVAVHPGILLIGNSVSQGEGDGKAGLTLRCSSFRFRVVGVESSSPDLVVSRDTPDESLDEHRFSVFLKSGSSAIGERTKITFLLDSEEQPRVSVPVYATK